MINPPPPDDLDERESLAQTSQQQEYQRQDSSSFYDDEDYRKEPSGFGFIALVAGLISLAAFGGIIIYSVLLAPRAPKQAILIEAEGTTKSVPSDAQVKPEPNSDVGVFRMLRGAGREDGKNGDGSDKEQSASSTGTSGRSLSLTAVPREQDKSGTKVESITSTPESNYEQENVESGKSASDADSNNSLNNSEDAAAKSTNELGRNGGAVASKDATQESTQESTVGSAEPSTQGSWYVQIAALESRSAADRAWTRLHDRLPELLYTQKYIAKEARLASGKRVWRLLLGPQGQGGATTLCRALQSRSQSCIVKRLDK